MRMTRRTMRGFTLIELLMVVAIVGLLAAIGVWNYLIALDRAKQKKTVTDMRSIALAWEQRATDIHAYNAAGQVFTFPSEAVSYDQLTSVLTPTYLRNFPADDGWGNAFAFGLDEPFGSAEKARHYAIRSRGRDGQLDSAYPVAATTDFDCDIVFSNSAFVIYPEGETQQ